MPLSAAAFVLAINIFVASLFAIAFAVVAVYQRPAPGAAWLASGYAIGILSPLLEFILPYQRDHRLVSFGIFAALLWALAAFVIGMAYCYRLRRPWRALAVLLALSMLTNLLILDMPRDNLLRGLLYQGPYMALHLVAAFVLIGYRNWRALDLVLLALLVVSSLHFLGKPILAHLIGSGDAPQAYLSSTYAGISQSFGAALLITNGLVMLLIILRDKIAEITARSEIDTLSGLLNRRGFEDRGRRLLAQMTRHGVPAVMIVADLDHFKSVNDSFGHAAGDQVIASFASLLTENASQNSVVGRLGGEEFAILISNANPMTGKLYAESVRIALSGLPPETMGLQSPVTASFGVAGLRQGDTLSDLLRRADVALYQAKSEGRNKVCLFMDTLARPPLSVVSRTS